MHDRAHGHFKIGLAGGQQDETFRLLKRMVMALSVFRCSTELSRQATTQLLAVTCLKVQCGRRPPADRDGPDGVDSPQRGQAESQHSDRSQRHCGGQPTT